MSEPSAAELEALADHARRRVALYRRRVYVGRGDAGHLSELERIADGAVARMRRARAVSPSAPPEAPDPTDAASPDTSG